jgi:hypothetical protein
MDNILWFKIGNSQKKRQIKLNHRTAGYDVDTKEVLLCADAFGGETRNFLCMSADGIKLVYAYGSLFCPASWLKKEFPGMTEDIDAITAKVVKYAGESK